MEEKTETGADASSKLGSSSVQPADKRSKDKTKLDDDSLENPVDVPLSRATLREDSEPAGWDDPFACQLEEFLLSNMLTIFQNATKMIIDCGYEEAVARKAILRRSGFYQRDKDLVSNVVNDALASLKKGEGGDILSSMLEMVCLDGDILHKLVEYAMVEMIGVLRMVNPSLSVAEAMWRLLLFDLNISMACETGEEVLEESFSDLTNPKHPVANEALSPERDGLVPVGASREYIPVASTSERKPATGRKGRSKKGMKNASSKTKIIIKVGGSADESHRFLTNSSPGLDVADNSSILSMNCTKYAAPTTNTGLAISSSSSSSSGNKPVPKSVGRTPKSSKTPDPEAEGISSMSTLSTDYFAGIPYDKSLGIYIPQDEKDKWILKVVPLLQELQNELDSWTQWTNKKVKEAVLRISKAQDEIKSLRREKEEAEQLNKEEKIMEEMRLFEMEVVLTNKTNQVENARSRLHKLKEEKSMLKTKTEIANVQAAASAATSASTCRKAFEIEQKALKDVQSRDAQRRLFQKELASEKKKAAELDKKLAKAQKIDNETQELWKQERMTMEKFLAQAASIRKERECLEAAAQIEEDKMKLKAENDLQEYGEEVKKLKDKLSELKVRLGSSGLWRGTDGFNGQSPSVNEGNETKGVVDINDYSGSRHRKQERECVMCLSEDKTVVFLPCAHQVLCVNCNEVHQKKGMKNCPTCRSPITRRICVRFR